MRRVVDAAGRHAVAKFVNLGWTTESIKLRVIRLAVECHQILTAPE